MLPQTFVIRRHGSGWAIFYAITGTLIEGGFSSRQAAEDYLAAEYADEAGQ
jgi:hypothetical protein